MRGRYRKISQDKSPEKVTENNCRKLEGRVREYPARQMTALVHVRDGGAFAGPRREDIAGG